MNNDNTNNLRRHCDLCGSDNHREAKRLQLFLGLESDNLSIIKCKQCNLVSLYPRPTQETLDAFYRDYGSKKKRLADERFREEHIYPDKIERLKAYTEGRRLLDIGAGMGTFVKMAEESGFKAVGIELSAEQCQMAQDLYGVQLIKKNLYDIADELGRFDVVNLHHVMEHLISPSAMLEIVYSLLAPNGILLVEVPHQLPRIKDHFQLRKNQATFLRFNLDHLFFFTPKIMKRYLLMHGFSIIRFRQFPPSTREAPKNRVWRLARTIYRHLTTVLWVPSGRIIEFYCRKTPKP